MLDPELLGHPLTRAPQLSSGRRGAPTIGPISSKGTANSNHSANASSASIRHILSSRRVIEPHSSGRCFVELMTDQLKSV
jgi:hypothetical protein